MAFLPEQPDANLLHCKIVCHLLLVITSILVTFSNLSTSAAMHTDDPVLEGETQPGKFGRQITRESVSQQAYKALRNSLMRSRLKPGQKLVARQVADELGISVTPVRESLLRLVSEHALDMDDRGTVMVPNLALERCIEIRDLRMVIEGEGAARAALTATEHDINELMKIHHRYVETESSSNFATALAENENFHFGLCHLAKSPVLFRMVENLWMQFGPILSYLYDGRERPFHGQKHGHVLVLEALRKRDSALARQAISEDILIGGKALLEKLQS
jgi:DNA-binding GntR family transcriptional regulator